MNAIIVYFILAIIGLAIFFFLLMFFDSIKLRWHRKRYDKDIARLLKEEQDEMEREKLKNAPISTQQIESAY